ncbi:PP0621 family protein [Roseateles sp. BYS180W]|uniref:PP0621 family protein n=1 Tax=Roseateles rivi TaxID=3299028 RepID=A0ABW7FWA2_9BURK
MKYLLLILVLGLLCFVLGWRRGSARPTQNKSSPRPSQTQAADMVACAWCGVHVPVGEAVHGRLGLFCSDAHRVRKEGQTP